MYFSWKVCHCAISNGTSVDKVTQNKLCWIHWETLMVTLNVTYLFTLAFKNCRVWDFMFHIQIKYFTQDVNSLKSFQRLISSFLSETLCRSPLSHKLCVEPVTFFCILSAHLRIFLDCGDQFIKNLLSVKLPQKNEFNADRICK